MKIALVEIANPNNITVVEDGNYRLDLPDGSQISPVEAGWTGTTYKLVNINFAPNPPTYLESVRIGSNAGLGYTANNVLTIFGGAAQGNVAQIRVNAIGSNGLVSSLLVSNSGYYTADPGLDNAPTGGSGSGLRVDLQMVSHTIATSTYTYEANTGTVNEATTFVTPVIDNTNSLELQRQNTIEGDAQNLNLKDKLRTASAAQIDAWLLTNVTNLAEARVVLGAIIKLLATKFRHGGTL